MAEVKRQVSVTLTLAENEEVTIILQVGARTMYQATVPLVEAEAELENLFRRLGKRLSNEIK